MPHITLYRQLRVKDLPKVTGPYLAARVGSEPATLRMQGTKQTETDRQRQAETDRDRERERYTEKDRVTRRHTQ